MAIINERKTEYSQNPNTHIIVKKISVEDNKHSIDLKYRLDKDGSIKVSGFDVKAYGSNANVIKNQADELIQYGIQRMDEPHPEED